MSTKEEKPKKPRRPRQEFTVEYKAQAVKLVVEEGKSIPQVARDLDLTESALRLWVEQTKTDRGEGKPGALTTAEREGEFNWSSQHSKPRSCDGCEESSTVGPSWPPSHVVARSIRRAA
nr:transposase [Corallococcus carmarthensis]